jgi:hypothetical protein
VRRVARTLSPADPARETNNNTITYFTVSGGQIGNVRSSP